MNPEEGLKLSPLLRELKPKLEEMQKLYQAGYEAGLVEGRRQAWIEVKTVLDREAK